MTTTAEVDLRRPELVPTVAAPEEPWLQVLGSRHFPAWLAEQRISLAFTTYQAGKLLLLGLQADGRLSVFERTFNRCMGLCGDGQTLWLSTVYQLWRFENALAPKRQVAGLVIGLLPRADGGDRVDPILVGRNDLRRPDLDIRAA